MRLLSLVIFLKFGYCSSAETTFRTYTTPPTPRISTTPGTTQGGTTPQFLETSPSSTEVVTQETSFLSSQQDLNNSNGFSEKVGDGGRDDEEIWSGIDLTNLPPLDTYPPVTHHRDEPKTKLEPPPEVEVESTSPKSLFQIKSNQKQDKEIDESSSPSPTPQTQIAAGQSNRQNFEPSPLGEILSSLLPFLSPQSIERFLSIMDMILLVYYNWRILTTIKF